MLPKQSTREWPLHVTGSHTVLHHPPPTVNLSPAPCVHGPKLSSPNCGPENKVCRQPNLAYSLRPLVIRRPSFKRQGISFTITPHVGRLSVQALKPAVPLHRCTTIDTGWQCR